MLGLTAGLRAVGWLQLTEAVLLVARLIVVRVEAATVARFGIRRLMRVGTETVSREQKPLGALARLRAKLRVLVEFCGRRKLQLESHPRLAAAFRTPSSAQVSAFGQHESPRICELQKGVRR